MQVSIVIPHFNRCEQLDICLEHLAKQKFPFTDFEVIIIDDGSTDQTPGVIKKWQPKIKNLVYHRQKNQGASAARNQGITLARAPITILIGNDIYCSEEFVYQHYNFHKKNPDHNVACLGLVLWYPKATITPLMAWSTNETTFFGKFGGHQFAYNLLKKQNPDYRFFYTANLSLKTDTLKNESFDPWFGGYGWEDIELGYRLQKTINLKISYNENALAYHDHYISAEAFKRRMKGIGKNAVHFQHKHPELNILPQGQKLKFFQFLSHKATQKFLYFSQKFIPLLKPVYFYALSKYYYLEGIKESHYIKQKLSKQTF